MSLTVIKNFTLTGTDGAKQSFVAGEKITGKLADHWFVKAHSTADEGDSPTETTDAPKGKGKKAKAAAPADTAPATTDAPTETTDAPAV